MASANNKTMVLALEFVNPLAVVSIDQLEIKMNFNGFDAGMPVEAL